MAAMFCDLDGTAMLWGTNTFLPGAYERLKNFYDSGNELIFTTLRDPQWGEIEPTEPFLKSLFPKCIVLFGISSPRILINDHGAVAINHPRDTPWYYDFSNI